MPVITFWSNNKKAIGQTVAASLAATVMAMEHNYKILLVSADYNDTIIEDCFGAQESNRDIVKTIVKNNQINLDSGINGLFKLAESNRLTPEVIHDYTKIIFKNRLEVLYSPKKIEKERASTIMEEYKNIIVNASRYYDYVIVDLKKGLEYQSQLEILTISDVLVASVEQSTKAIESFLAENQIKSLRNKLVWNICKYDNKSKFNSKNITRKILRKEKIYETPYNTLVFDAIQEDTIIGLLIRLKTLKNEDANLEFINKIQELVNGILEKYQETRYKM